jgi:hypothetical protein
VPPPARSTWRDRLFARLGHASATSSVAGDAGGGDPSSAEGRAAHAAPACKLPVVCAVRGRSASRDRGAGGGTGGSFAGAASAATARGGSTATAAGGPTTADPPPPPLPWAGDSFWSVDWDELRPSLTRKIGSGSFGTVWEAWFRHTAMAVKIISLDDDLGMGPADGDGPAHHFAYPRGPDPAVLERFKAEVDLQRRLSLHPNIVRFLGACYHVPAPPPPPPPPPPPSRLGGWRRCRPMSTTGGGGGDSAPATPPSALAGAGYGTAGGTPTLAIIMELCRLGSLFRLLSYARRVARLPPDVRAGASPPRTPEQARLRTSPGFRLYSSWTTRLTIAQQVAAAMAFMHSQHVLHR